MAAPKTESRVAADSPLYSSLMKIDPTEISPRKIYRLMTFAITPRPIAWVGTVSAQGIANLAPFSFFNGVCANPPTVVFSVTNRRDGSMKDTLRNILAVPEFTISTVSFSEGEQMNATSAELPYEVSEFAACQVSEHPSERIRPPRVASAKLAMECVLHQLVPVGEGPLAGTLVIGRIVLVHLEDGAVDSHSAVPGDPDPQVLDTIGRMGGDGYCRTLDRFVLHRPTEK